MRYLLAIWMVFIISIPTFAQDDSAASCQPDLPDEIELDTPYDVTCAADCTEGVVWGTGVYTDDSNLCQAAIHAGVIEAGEGGVVEVIFTEGRDSYMGSEQNGVSSNNWGAWERSFTFADADQMIALDWTTRADEIDIAVDTPVQATCPPEGEVGAVWGTTIYASPSSICSAAVHAGLITLAEGGEFYLMRAESLTAYVGSEQMAIESDDWNDESDDWDDEHTSFIIFDDVLELEWDQAFISIDFGSIDMESELERSYLGMCPAEGEVGSIWGTDIYTDDSKVCTAALHAGAITLEDGGHFLVTSVAGQESYTGSEQNGVSSGDWGAWEGSFRIDALPTDSTEK